MSVNGNYNAVIGVEELAVGPITLNNEWTVEKLDEDNNKKHLVINIPDDTNNDENDDNSNNNDNNDSDVDLEEHRISLDDEFDEGNNHEYQDEESYQVINENAVGTPSILGLKRAISKLLFPSAYPTTDKDGGRNLYKQKSLTKIVVDNITLDSTRASSRFSTWTRYQVIQILIKENIELRGESFIPFLSLRELVDQLYEGYPMPSRPIPPNLEELARNEYYVSKVQNVWINRSERHRHFLLMQQLTENFGNEFDYVTPIESQDFNDLQNDEDSDKSQRLSNNFKPFQLDSNLDVHVTRSVNTIVEEEIPEDDSQEKKRKSVTFSDLNESVDFRPVSNKSTNQKGLHMTKSMHIAKKAIEFLDQKWVPPDWERAQRDAAIYHPRKGKDLLPYNFYTTTTGRHCCLGGCGEQCDPWREGKISEFSSFGPGVSNYFKFLKWSFWLFVILTLVSFPCLLLNLYGPNQYLNGLTTLATTTVANFAIVNSTSSSNINIPGCVDYGGFLINCSISKDAIAQVYSWIDVIICVIILTAFIWLIIFENYEEKQLNQSTFYPSMYTIMVSNLPANATEDSLNRYFSNLLDNKYPIASCSIAYDNERDILESISRGDLIRKKKRLIHEHRYNCTFLRYQSNYNPVYFDNEISKLRTEFFIIIKKIDQEINDKQKILEDLSKTHPLPLIAFITFNDEIASKLILKKYKSLNILSYYFSKHDFRLPNDNKSSKLLVLDPAPEASIIIWQNLRYSFIDRLLRKSITTILSLILIFISVSLTFGAKYYSLRYDSANGSATTTCPANFESLTRQQQQQLIISSPNYLHCYCSRYDDFTLARERYCKLYLNQKLSSEFFTFFSSLGVLLTNTIIEIAIMTFADFEKHHSDDTKAQNIFIRLFLLKYINTGAIFLFESNYSILKDIYGASTQNTSEFSPAWFNSIGVTILLVQMGNIFLAHINRLTNYFIFKRRLHRSRHVPKAALTQDDLNKAQKGPVFELAYSYAQVLSTFYVCMTFGTGMPLLYAITAANFFIFYFLEKYLFINAYQSPPRYNMKIPKLASELIPYGVLLHLGMSIWILSNSEYFSSQSGVDSSTKTIETSTESYVHNGDFSSRLFTRQTFRLFIFFCALVSVRFIAYLFTQLGNFLSLIFRLICGVGYSNSNDLILSTNEKDVNVITYTRAIQRNLIKGVVNYKILENRNYREAFGISIKFAVSHKGVNSIRLNRGAENAEEDDEYEKVLLARVAVITATNAAATVSIDASLRIRGPMPVDQPQQPFDLTVPSPAAKDFRKINFYRHESFRVRQEILTKLD